MIAGVLLAAGASRRMGRPKPLVRERGESFLTHGVRHLWVACDRVVVVLGAGADRVRSEVEREFVRLTARGALHGELRQARRHGAAGLEVRFHVNASWRSGMYSSVRAGLREALRFKPEAVLVLPVDHPAIRPRTVEDLASLMRAALRAHREPQARARFAYGLIPRHRRRRGHPIALTPALARAIARDVGAHDLSDAIRRNAALLGYLDVPDPGIVRNRNRPGD
ncbi:MAG: hypothetical protein A2W00_14930 [Candidatus Eisenbacteria bacterium RBG_16_71_46]|nr:MAG: hypothetical protein A2W00_14930 [Candidatus Eisenbacteria bacterium RBG_16_71_46]